MAQALHEKEPRLVHSESNELGPRTRRKVRAKCGDVGSEMVICKHIYLCIFVDIYIYIEISIYMYIHIIYIYICIYK